MLNGFSFRRSFGFPAAAALILAPIAARAQSCGSSANERAQINRDAVALMSNNPGSGLVFGSCVAVGANKYQEAHNDGDATAAFGVCAALGCAVTDSYSNCVSVNTQLFLYALRAIKLEADMRAEGCQP